LGKTATTNLYQFEDYRILFKEAFQHLIRFF
jgi:hypothetical protein